MIPLLLVAIAILLGAGAALAIAGRRYKIGLLWWGGIMILTVIGLYLVVYFFLLISCWTGAGCL